MMFVGAYIEYTAFHGPLNQYMAAIEYLHELEARYNPPAPKPDRLRPPTHPMDPKERERLIDFIGGG